MSSKSSSSTIDTNSSAIKSEILRFESVHPNIYAIYDLIDSLCNSKVNVNLINSLKEYVVGIEDAFVNSQEWTLSNNVPDIKLGLLGSVKSGKSALIHRYLTGSYVHDDSPEGGRFKKEIFIEDKSHLLLIRDEGGPPDEQFSNWIDGVIFVFSTDSEESFQTVSEYYSRLLMYRANDDFPIILVGTMDYNCENKARVIDDAMARRLANDLHRCPYFESCATYGFNVENVIQEACHMIIQTRRNQKMYPSSYQTPMPPPRDGSMNFPQHPSISRQGYSQQNFLVANQMQSSVVAGMQSLSLNKTVSNVPLVRQSANAPQTLLPNYHHQQFCSNSTSNGGNNAPVYRNQNDQETDNNEDNSQEAINREPGTPGSTPTQSRKIRRKSNLFKKLEEDKKGNRIGSGRAIPLKQGFLYKRRTRPLNKEWKSKKYVTLTDDGRLTYHPTIHEYMENIHGKEIDLCRTTVKIPGIAFRQAGSQLSSTKITSNGLLLNNNQLTPSSSSNNNNQNGTDDQKDNPLESDKTDSRRNGVKENSAKKRQRRIRANPKSGILDDYDSEGYEFQLISVDRTWCFEALTRQDRDEWVELIEQTTMSRLQGIESNKTAMNNYGGYFNHPGGHPLNPLNSDPNSDYPSNALRDKSALSIQNIPGNNICADCSNPDPDWASINLGCLVCIECSGSHRQLGTHISRIRSISLDDWNHECFSVMQAIGNTLSNSIWEAASSAANKKKPNSKSRREEKEAWIRAKYERKEFLPPLPYPDAPLQQQLMDAIARQDTRQVILCLALATPDIVNSCYSQQDSRASIHIAATLGSIVYLQLLLWYNGDPSITDSNGRNAFYYAHCSQKYDCAEFLLRNGCPRQEVPLPNLKMLPQQTNSSSTGPFVNSPTSQPQLNSPPPSSSSTNFNRSDTIVGQPTPPPHNAGNYQNLNGLGTPGQKQQNVSFFHQASSGSLKL